MAADQLTRYPVDGTNLGQDTSDKIAFYGKTPVAQRAGAAQAAVATSTITTAATTTSPWGFATSTQADAIPAQIVLLRTLLNEVRANLVEIGTMKGAA